MKSFSEVTLNFLLIDFLLFPKFIFHEFPHLSVTSMLEFLVYKNVLSKRSKRLYTIINRQNINFAFFGFASPSSLKRKDSKKMTSHNLILKSFNVRPFLNCIPPVTYAEFESSDITSIKKQIFKRGIDSKSRPKIWTQLLNLTQDIHSTLYEEYKLLKLQFSNLTSSQISNNKILKDSLRIIELDVKRNDRKTPAFSSDDSPNLILLKQVLIIYSIYNRDIGYIQGMADIVSVLILLYFKEWQDNEKVVLYNNEIIEREEAENFIFWHFVRIFEITQTDRMFNQLKYSERFILKVSACIAFSGHEPIRELLSGYSPKIISFLLRPVLLLFKREFKNKYLLILWDSIFAAEEPFVFIRFITAAILVFIYPKLLEYINNKIEVSNILEDAAEKIDVNSIKKIAFALMKEVKKSKLLKESTKKAIYGPLLLNTDFVDYSPQYFNLK